jgi:Fe-S oxidoreductase/nitrate reductase gamma subunit
MHPINGVAGFLFFIFLWGISLWFFVSALYGRVNLLARGKQDSRFDRPWERAACVLRNVVMHSSLLREPYPGVLHLFIFYGFMVLAIGNLFLFGEALSPTFFQGALDSSFYGVVSLVEDIFCVLVYAGLAMAAYRRYVIRPDRLERSSSDATIIILLITGIVSCALFVDVFRFAAAPQLYAYQEWAVVASFLSRFFVGLPPSILEFFYLATWWIHLILILTFIVYIPRSKHMHLIACPFNEYFRNLQPKGRMSEVDIENAESFGAEKIEDFAWKQLLDLFACVECGRCMENCPTARSGKTLNPKFLISDLKNHLLERGPELVKTRSSLLFQYVVQKGLPIPIPAHERELLVKEGFIKPDEKTGQLPAPETTDGEAVEMAGGAIKEETIWDCTTCGYCIEHCPFFIEHTSKILEMRRYLTLMLKSYPTQVKNFFKNVQRNSNPWGIGWQQRADWAKDRKVRMFGESDDIEWLLYVGCAGSFDARNMKVTSALCDLLDMAGVTYGILGKDEKCCGETARRMGEEGLFQSAVETNVEIFKELNVRKIITLCPHCLNTFKNEYPDFGGRYEVLHHSELLSKLVMEGKLKPRNALPLRVAFHDSCYLGRYNNIYESPRALIASATGNPVLEMPRNHDRSFCCGAGGGRMWMEETEGEKINLIRTREGLETGANCLASACPYCLTMLSDGVKAENREDVVTKDIAEILLESLV